MLNLLVHRPPRLLEQTISADLSFNESLSSITTLAISVSIVVHQSVVGLAKEILLTGKFSQK
jgi:hypothetical protein